MLPRRLFSQSAYIRIWAAHLQPSVKSFFAIIYLAALFSISSKLTFIVLIILPLQMGFLASVGPFLRRRLRRAFTLQAVHQSRLIESFTNLEAIKAHVKEPVHTIRPQ